ncbi:agamous-like MADS-box protein AGL29 [Cinnamomum micranthum f. kanehirae]|uniref:Agamous-like MADS-box protein AGL29 n=1 Tax=Cinnamomum micranthum f. kanehirae TaxID=337451 RepID=A0A443PB02_9MAGN|nr:agamous-like MADS-box protein AGL29 [Cinnamomum micranthum f. kanehirae]
MGKRKIEMKKIEGKQKRFVTLSKKKEGLFKKAQKLALDFGVVVAVIGFTVGGRPFSFGSSSVDDIIDKYDQNHRLQFTEQEKIHTVIHQEKSNIKLINSEGSIGNELMEYASALTMLKDMPVQTMAGISQKNNCMDDHSIVKAKKETMGLLWTHALAEVFRLGSRAEKDTLTLILLRGRSKTREGCC